MRLFVLLTAALATLPLVLAFGAAYPGSFYRMVLRMAKPRKNARTAPSPNRLWAYLDRPSSLDSQDSVYYRATSPPQFANQQRRFHSNSYKPSKLRYNSKKDRPKYSVVIPTSTTPTPFSTTLSDPRTTRVTNNISKLSSPEEQLAGQQQPLQPTLSPQDLHRQKEFYEKFEQLQLEQIKKHDVQPLMEREKQEILPTTLTKVVTSNGQAFSAKKSEVVKSSGNVMWRENHQIPQSFVNHKPPNRVFDFHPVVAHEQRENNRNFPDSNMRQKQKFHSELQKQRDSILLLQQQLTLGHPPKRTASPALLRHEMVGQYARREDPSVAFGQRHDTGQQAVSVRNQDSHVPTEDIIDNNVYSPLETESTEEGCGGQFTFELDPTQFIHHPKQRAFHTQVQSPGFGNGAPYAQGLKCIWTVHIGPSCQYGMLVYTVLQSRIRRSHSCQEDHLDVEYNGKHVSRYCGPLSSQQKLSGAQIWSSTEPKNLTLLFESSSRPRPLEDDKHWGVKLDVSAYCWGYSKEFKQKVTDFKKTGTVAPAAATSETTITETTDVSDSPPDVEPSTSTPNSVPLETAETLGSENTGPTYGKVEAHDELETNIMPVTEMVTQNNDTGYTVTMKFDTTDAATKSEEHDSNYNELSSTVGEQFNSTVATPVETITVTDGEYADYNELSSTVGEQFNYTVATPVETKTVTDEESLEKATTEQIVVVNNVKTTQQIDPTNSQQTTPSLSISPSTSATEEEPSKENRIDLNLTEDLSDDRSTSTLSSDETPSGWLMMTSSVPSIGAKLSGTEDQSMNSIVTEMPGTTSQEAMVQTTSSSIQGGGSISNGSESTRINLKGTGEVDHSGVNGPIENAPNNSIEDITTDVIQVEDQEDGDNNSTIKSSANTSPPTPVTEISTDVMAASSTEPIPGTTPRPTSTVISNTVTSQTVISTSKPNTNSSPDSSLPDTTTAGSVNNNTNKGTNITSTTTISSTSPTEPSTPKSSPKNSTTAPASPTTPKESTEGSLSTGHDQFSAKFLNVPLEMYNSHRFRKFPW